MRSFKYTPYTWLAFPQPRAAPDAVHGSPIHVTPCDVLVQPSRSRSERVRVHRPPTLSSSPPAAYRAPAMASRDLTAHWLTQNAQRYRNPDRVFADVIAVLDRWPALRPKTDVYSACTCTRQCCAR